MCRCNWRAHRCDGHRGGGFNCPLKRVAASIGNMYPRLADVRIRYNSTGQFAFFGAPVGSVKHLRSGSEPAERIEQLVPFATICRQTLARQRHSQFVTLIGRYINRPSAHFIVDTALFQSADHISGRAALQPSI
ncbi:hypothetical protein EPIB1_89 [Tritonibacter mobilis]|nr:hypothetical protein EPIB1_89 [Tritonibacter mobilis]